MSVERPATYGVQVGHVWVEIDFEAQAVDICWDRTAKSVRTVEIEQGVCMLDYDAEGNLIAVEVLG